MGKIREMTRGEVLFMITTTPALVVSFDGGEMMPAQHFAYVGHLALYSWAIIDSAGTIIDGWNKFTKEEE